MEKLSRGPVLNRVIQDQIKQYITDNRLGAGDLLPPEGQLATDLGVSRGSVREAVKALESLGIVEVRHGDGVRVRAFNFDSVFDLLSYGLVFDPVRAAEVLQIRVWLEVAARGGCDRAGSAMPSWIRWMRCSDRWEQEGGPQRGYLCR